MTEEERKNIQMAFIRVCRDSGWRFDHARAAIFVGNLLKISPLEVWTAFGNLDTMEEIARGEHPVVNNPEYDNRRNKVK